ncbi:1-alkyl-2-acetylglycerophosphocholine esterase [Fusarium falciforme]|uniref:1-alkyl-2-acetylglycerophosphocholine esterase n=1 Tax=Fusarium falciforme TaxID=195108 RepID=UPI002301B45D|nr:1-alkyl-2-acetylglycerophosphocholine esterase [Fusarium falciforme]WAO93329.1 1-alkyl-2-acetylglycerophosphocholine esterase [Fusarium falciforme]
MYIFVLLLSFLHFGNALLLPNPSGPYPVALKINTLTDNHRIDPYAPDHQKRRILTSIFWPVDSKSCSTNRVPYMPPATAAAYGAQAAQLGLSNDTFSVLEMEVCSVSKTSACQSSSGHKEAKFPLAVFSPGSGNSRLQYSAMARSLASYGYVVVLVDHPYDAAIVEFPDGTIIAGGNIPEDEKNLEKATQVRAADISFVISQVEKSSFQNKIFKGLPGKVDAKKTVALGHSLGGASAAAAVLSDSRIKGGMNLDGRLFNPVLSKGLNKPFMQLGRPNHRSEDTTWVKFWNKLTGPKIELAIAGTIHGSYLDTALVLKTLGLPKEIMKQTVPIVGSVDGEVLQKTVSELLSAFITYTFGGNKAALLKAVKGTEGVSVVKSQLR